MSLRYKLSEVNHGEDIVVVEKFGDKAAWAVTVSVFEMKGHRAYAWSSPIEGSAKRRCYAVLHIPPVDSHKKAVRASIERDQKVSQIT
jgi:hypothetical protein